MFLVNIKIDSGFTDSGKEEGCIKLNVICETMKMGVFTSNKVNAICGVKSVGSI